MVRLMFMVLMSVAHCNQSPDRMIWMKERSSDWWEHVVKSTFTPRDWLENFRNVPFYTYVTNYGPPLKKVIRQ